MNTRKTSHSNVHVSAHENKTNLLTEKIIEMASLHRVIIIAWQPRKICHIVFIQETESNTISNRVYYNQIFALEAKLQEFKEGTYHK